MALQRVGHDLGTKQQQQRKSLSLLKEHKGGPVVMNLPCSAGSVGSIPGQGPQIPHDLGHLSLCQTTNPTDHN